MVSFPRVSDTRYLCAVLVVEDVVRVTIIIYGGMCPSETVPNVQVRRCCSVSFARDSQITRKQGCRRPH